MSTSADAGAYAQVGSVLLSPSFHTTDDVHARASADGETETATDTAQETSSASAGTDGFTSSMQFSNSISISSSQPPTSSGLASLCCNRRGRAAVWEEIVELTKV